MWEWWARRATRAFCSPCGFNDGASRAASTSVGGAAPCPPTIVIAGLVPAIPIPEATSMRQFYVYILASRPGGAIYIGVTNNLVRRVYEHRNGLVPGFTKRYNIGQLVYFEVFSSARDAIQREKNMKHWPRVWKTRLIAQSNPSWRDLYDEIVS
jgi:putative endonuclease